jgi:hypothetical protein
MAGAARRPSRQLQPLEERPPAVAFDRAQQRGDLAQTQRE